MVQESIVQRIDVINIGFAVVETVWLKFVHLIVRSMCVIEFKMFRNKNETFH